MSDRIDAFGCFCVVLVGGMGLFLAACIIFLAFGLSSVMAGNAHYRYRCVDGVKEAQHVYWGVGFGLSRPVDGDPAGGCP